MIFITLGHIVIEPVHYIKRNLIFVPDVDINQPEHLLDLATRIYDFFSCKPQISMKFIQLINA